MAQKVLPLLVGRGEGGVRGSFNCMFTPKALPQSQCAMLPLYDRVLTASRKEFLRLHNRGIPIPTQPTTVGGYLRRRRMQLGILQPEAARTLGVSTVTLSGPFHKYAYVRCAQIGLWQGATEGVYPQRGL